MTELENKLVEKILEKLDMDKLTDKIAEKAAELIVQKEYPDPIPPIDNPKITPNKPWTFPTTPWRPLEPIVVMYGTTPVQYDVKSDIESIVKSASTNSDYKKE